MNEKPQQMSPNYDYRKEKNYVFKNYCKIGLKPQLEQKYQQYRQ